MKGPVFIAVAALAATITTGFDLELCSDSLNELGIRNITIPNLVTPGSDIDIEVSHEPNRYIGKGRFRLELDVEGVKVASTEYELCAVTSCSKLVPHVLSKSSFKFKVPMEIPGGFGTTLKMVVNDHDGAQLSCVHAHGVNVEPKMYALAKNEVSHAGGFTLSTAELKFLFNKWQSENGVEIRPLEEKKLMRAFAENLEEVAKHNAGSSTFRLGLNHFAHLTHDEFVKDNMGLKGAKPVNAETDKAFYSLDVATGGLTGIPDEVDWVKKGAVTPVKNQGSCGSCWAFSTVASIEGGYFLKTGKLLSFSEQQLVSCDKVDAGCNGGLMDQGFQFVEKNGGLCTEQSYPYKVPIFFSPRCKRKCTVVEGTAPSKFVDVASTEQSLEEAVAQRPVSIGIEADQLAFQFYRSGVLTAACGTAMDHGVEVVGYGTKNGVKYWKVKNSWGPSWGLKGYILLQRGKSVSGGECGILNSASYPVFD